MPSAKLERRPTYEMLELMPFQGEWSVGEYLALETNRIVEYTDEFLEFCPRRMRFIRTSIFGSCSSYASFCNGEALL